MFHHVQFYQMHIKFRYQYFVFIYPFVQDQTEVIGYAIGSLSGLFYLGSRLPQIIKNVSIYCGRQGVEYIGISLRIEVSCTV